MEIDQIDLQILSELQNDSRLSMRELSKRVNLSAPSVAERVRKLEETGVIEGYTLKVNYSALGFEVSCILEVTMRNGEYQKFQDYISKHPYCDFCYRIAGEACYLVKLSVRKISEIELFINEIAPFARTKTHIVFSEVKVSRKV